MARYARTSDTATVGDVIDFDILPASDDVYNFRTQKWEKLASGPNHAPNMAYLGWGIYVMKAVDSDPKRQKAAWSAAAHLGGKDLSMWTAAYPSGFQPYRKSHTNIDLWVMAGYDRKYITSYMNSQSTSYNHPNSAIEPQNSRHLPVLQHRGGRAPEGVRRKGESPRGSRQYCSSLGQTDRQARAGQPGQVLRISMGI